MPGIEDFICPHYGDQVFRVGEIDDIVGVSRQHMDSLDTVARDLKLDDFVRTDLALLDEAVVAHLPQRKVLLELGIDVAQRRDVARIQVVLRHGAAQEGGRLGDQFAVIVPRSRAVHGPVLLLEAGEFTHGLGRHRECGRIEGIVRLDGLVGGVADPLAALAVRAVAGDAAVHIVELRALPDGIDAFLS